MREEPHIFGDTRVIISAYQIGKLAMITRVLALYARRVLVIFDHILHADFVRVGIGLPS
jgi:hypothetical protein